MRRTVENRSFADMMKSKAGGDGWQVKGASYPFSPGPVTIGEGKDWATTDVKGNGDGSEGSERMAKDGISPKRLSNPDGGLRSIDTRQQLQADKVNDSDNIADAAKAQADSTEHVALSMMSLSQMIAEKNTSKFAKTPTFIIDSDKASDAVQYVEPVEIAIAGAKGEDDQVVNARNLRHEMYPILGDIHERHKGTLDEDEDVITPYLTASEYETLGKPERVGYSPMPEDKMVIVGKRNKNEPLSTENADLASHPMGSVERMRQQRYGSMSSEERNDALYKLLKDTGLSDAQIKEVIGDPSTVSVKESASSKITKTPEPDRDVITNKENAKDFGVNKSLSKMISEKNGTGFFAKKWDDIDDDSDDALNDMIDDTGRSLDWKTDDQVKTALDMEDYPKWAYNRAYNHTQLPIAQGIAMNRASIPEPGGVGDNYSDDYVINTAIRDMQNDIQAPDVYFDDDDDDETTKAKLAVEMRRDSALDALANANQTSKTRQFKESTKSMSQMIAERNSTGFFKSLPDRQIVYGADKSYKTHDPMLVPLVTPEERANFTEEDVDKFYNGEEDHGLTPQSSYGSAHPKPDVVGGKYTPETYAKFEELLKRHGLENNVPKSSYDAFLDTKEDDYQTANSLLGRPINHV